MKRHGYSEAELRAMTVSRLDITISTIAEVSGGRGRGKSDVERRRYVSKRRKRKT